MNLNDFSRKLYLSISCNFLAATLVLFLSLVISGQSEAKEIRYAISGYWEIYAYFNDNDVFGHCGAKTSNRNRSEFVTLTANKNGYAFFYDGDNWSLPVGEDYPSRTDIDGAYWTGRAKVYHKGGVMMTFDYSTGFGSAFASGNLMTISIGSKTTTVGLSGSRAAINILSECFSKYIPNQNPFESPEKGTKNPFQ